MFYEKSNILNSVNETAHAARTGDYGKAASCLNKLLQLLQAEIAKGKITSEGLKKITFSLETLLEMQTTGDWVAFGDILEYEFAENWKRFSSEF